MSLWTLYVHNGYTQGGIQGNILDKVYLLCHTIPCGNFSGVILGDLCILRVYSGGIFGPERVTGGAAWCGAARHGAARHGTVRRGTAWYGAVRIYTSSLERGIPLISNMHLMRNICTYV